MKLPMKWMKHILKGFWRNRKKTSNTAVAVTEGIRDFFKEMGYPVDPKI
jgi:hypothetical protein